MAYFKRCDKCGCTLDPAEYRICSDCLEEEEKRNSMIENYSSGLDGQMNYMKMIRRVHDEQLENRTVGYY